MLNNFCQELSPILILIGQVITIFKLSLPLILIILGIFDISKAVISSKSDDIKKYMTKFLKKVAFCILVFFVPTICMIIFGFVKEFDDIKSNENFDFNVCYNCLFESNNQICKEAVKIASTSK